MLAVIFAGRYLLGQKDDIGSSDKYSEKKAADRPSHEMRTCKSENDLRRLTHAKRTRTRSERSPECRVSEEPACESTVSCRGTHEGNYKQSKNGGMRSLEECKGLLKQPVCTFSLIIIPGRCTASK